ncbi:hypothetical protein N7463_009449 [Penicillium fimorum]|uniref:Peptidase M20 dimerisation domain-containing protein n=1 Tax=Penicillium fimorum TaxID=1882269 RepID=A0A9W9XQS9_9EURO|nr:hypothetical protein N7463_009449 [Penicillium fimorum]
MEHITQNVDEWIRRDTKAITELVSALVQCQTPSPPGDTRGAMILVEKFLSARDLSFKRVTAEDTMPNLLSTIPMATEGRHLMLSGHLDVLPAGDEPGWHDDPWRGKIVDGRIWGRGTSDMKAGVAVMLFSYYYMFQLRKYLSGRLSLALASDEETGMGRGTGHMFTQIPSEMEADCVLSPEPSGTEAITFSSKGYLQFNVSVATRGAISGYPNQSPSAIRIAADIIRDLDELENISAELPPSIKGLLEDAHYREWYNAMYGEGSAEVIPAISVNVGTIAGGSSPSVISPGCFFEVTVVTPTGMDPEVVFKEAKAIVGRYPEAQIEFEGADIGDISATDHEMPVILQNVVTKLGWPKPKLTPDIAISDLRYWRYRGIPGFWYGPDGDNVSAANENVEIQQVLHLVRTYVLASVQYLQEDSSL